MGAGPGRSVRGPPSSASPAPADHAEFPAQVRAAGAHRAGRGRASDGGELLLPRDPVHRRDGLPERGGARARGGRGARRGPDGGFAGLRGPPETRFNGGSPLPPALACLPAACASPAGPGRCGLRRAEAPDARGSVVRAPCALGRPARGVRALRGEEPAPASAAGRGATTGPSAHWRASWAGASGRSSAGWVGFFLTQVLEKYLFVRETPVY